MLGRLVAVGALISIASLASLLSVTKPSTVGPFGILLVFIFMYMSALGVLTLLLFGVSRAMVRITALLVVKKPIMPLTLRRSYYYSSVLALAPVMFIGMQSVGEVGFYDVILISIFVAIACVYISKRIN
jgi:hypothetical protein